MAVIAPAAADRGALPLHGGNLGWAGVAFPHATLPWVDLSTGVNPWAYPYTTRPIAWHRLPEPEALDDLICAARRYYRIPSSSAVTAIAGAESAIRLLPRLLNPSREVCIVGPTYSSHTDAWRQGGHFVKLVPALDEIMPDAIAVLVSPNNPDGRCIDRETLKAIGDRHARNNSYVIADRSFADVSDDPDAMPTSSALIELRSFGKFFGLPGLRIAFVIADDEIIRPLRQVVGAWPMNTAALEIGKAALSDEVWQRETRSKLEAAGTRLVQLLERHLAVVGRTNLFCLAQVPHAARLFRHLGVNGILSRVFDYNDTWIRFGLPTDDQEQARLADALETYREKS